MIQKSDLSASVLQGFSCSSVQTLPQEKAKDLVKACRPRAGRDKVLLEEAQSLVFLENSENLQLFNSPGISTSVLEYYTNELYIQNPDFNLLGQCVGLTVGQISSAPSDVINSSLTILSNINGWDQGQVNSLIQSILSAGFTISSASSLESLGTLIGGVPSATFSTIPSSQFLSLSQNPTFVDNILSAPVILQTTFVQKVISVDQTKVIQNVPDALVMYIPLVLLTSLSSGDISLINNKSWSHEQAMMLFGAVASASDDPEDLSASVLQGFSCSSVQTLPQEKAKDLVKACRPRAGRDKVLLEEAQLTCMYNYVKDDPSVSFTDVPSDMLLYYSYDKVQKVNCQAYFSALGRADFSVLSLDLDKTTVLFDHAKDCLGISGVSLTGHQVEVLGNMACTLDSSYIQSSDPIILENLKNCGDLSDSQMTAVQSVLLSGNTAYGNPSTWNEDTVEQLSNLAVYFKSNLCDKIPFNIKRKFISALRKQKIPLKKLRALFTECNTESTSVSNITAVTISDPSFPFGFNSTQFDLYLDITVLQENLAAITEKVVDTSLQTIILNKLNQIYPSGLNDDVLQLLGSTSRVATTDDIREWNITIIDTLSSLMDSNDGPWEEEKSKAVIMRYLNTGTHSLGSAEINVVGSNICTLDISVLENITAESLTSVLSPDLSSCSIEQKTALYTIANSSFSSQHSSSTTFYQLISPYLGGAPVEDIQTLSAQNISMDISIFTSLNPSVLKFLNVSTVRDLLGMNVADLKIFENSSMVQSWVSQQKQSELDILNLGIINLDSNNNTIISTTTPSTRTATDTTIPTVNTPVTFSAILNSSASPTTSFEITPSIGTTVNMTAATSEILNSSASPTTSFEITPSIGTTVNMTAPTSEILNSSASPTTSFEITPSIGTTVNMTAPTSEILNSSASPTTSFEITPSIGTTVNMTAPTSEILNSSASPTTSFEITPSIGTTVNMTAATSEILNSSASPTTSFEITPSIGTTVNMTAATSEILNSSASPTTSFEITPSIGTTVNMTAATSEILNSSASPTTSFEITPSIGTTVNMTAATSEILNSSASSTTSFEITPSIGTTVNMTAPTSEILNSSASPTTSFEITPSIGTTVNMTAPTSEILNSSASSTTSFEITPSIGTTVNMTAATSEILNSSASPTTSFEITPSIGTTVNMTAATSEILNSSASPTTSFEITPSIGTTVNMTAPTSEILNSSASPTTSFEITPSIGTTVNMTAATSEILNSSASPTTSFEITPSIGTTVNMTAATSEILNSSASPTTSFEITPSIGTTVNMTAPTSEILNSSASPTTSFKITPSIGTTVNMTAATSEILNSSASPTTSFEITPSIGTTVNMTAPTSEILNSSASPTTSFEITPSIGTTVNMTAATSEILNSSASPTTSFEFTPSIGTTVNMTAATSEILNSSASPTTSFEITPSIGTTVNMTAPTSEILNSSASPTTSFEITPSFGTTVNMTAATSEILNSSASPTTSFEITPSIGTTVNMTAATSEILNSSASPTTSFEITPSIGTTVNMTAATSEILNSSASPTTSFEITPSIGTTVNMTAPTSEILNSSASPTTSFEITPSFGTTVNMTAATSEILNSSASPTTSFEITPSIGTTVNMTAPTSEILNSSASPTTSFEITPPFGTTVNMTASISEILNTSAYPTTSIKITTSFENSTSVPDNPCQGVDSQAIETALSYENASAVLCNFSITDYACSSVSGLSTDDLAKLLKCKITGNVKYTKDIWKLFFHNVAANLDEALDKVYNMTFSSADADPNILDAIGEVIIDKFTAAQLTNATFITDWFHIRLRSFLSLVSKDFLSSLSSKTFSCETYQIVVEALSSQESLMKEEQKQMIFNSFIFPFLLRDDLPDPACLSNTSGSDDWLEKNLGGFSDYAPLEELKLLNANFSSVAVLGLLSSEQKAQFILQPDSVVLGNDSVFREVFTSVLTSSDVNQLGSFFEAFNQTVIQMNVTIPSAISDSILNMTLLDLVPHFQSFSPEDFALWFQTYLSLFLTRISSNTLSIIPINISCDSYREIVKGLDNVYSDLSATQSNTVFSYTQDYLEYQSSQGLSCYGTGSFYVFLKQLFLSFGFPDLNDFLSLIPADRQAQLLSSISPEELSEFLNRPNTVNNASELCSLLDDYNRTNEYLETEPVLPSAVASYTLGCVWSRALTASSQAEVEQWFNVTLVHYLPYLNSHLISSDQLSGASCLSYRKLVSILGDNYNFSATDFTPADVYSSIKVYLNSSDGSPRCYNSSDPLLNSTAWFADNIGFFITFIKLTDLQSFISDSKIGVFLENSENLQLFNNSQIAANVTEYYTTQLYIQNPTFNPLRLPGGLVCKAPSSVFVSLGDADIQNILSNINKFCNETNPEITATLVEKFPTLSESTVQLLGSQCVGLTVGQINSAPYSVIQNNLDTLSNINGWDQGQASALIQSIISLGFKINSASSLLSLGTLIEGVPSATISSIPSSQLLTLSQNPTFINNILSAPGILQETYVQQVISADQTKVMENVPNSLVMYIPVVLLSSQSSVNVSLINNKSWSHEQAIILFGAVTSDDPEDLSASVLQGFSCSSVQTLPQEKAKDLVKACRPRAGRGKVQLEEAQLTCMYNIMKEDSVNFADVPSDMLLYYNYDKVKNGNCSSYFTALGGADFSVPSSILNIAATQFNNARDCLGISGVSLTRHQVEVLGNMACTLDSSYIQSSDPIILENLKNCGDLSDSQMTAVQSVLLSGNTAYGNPLKWNAQTLRKLGILPLYFKSDFWEQFSYDVKKSFLKSFMPFLRNQKTPIQKLRNFFVECNSKSSKINRAAVCTTGQITAVTIADASFPLGYDSTQFDLCLNNTVLKDNLAAITEKVVDPSFQTVILNKLNQLYPTGINDGVLQLLGSTSRMATIDEISKWNISIIDTLFSLMAPNNGNWTTELSNAVISRYLGVANHTLGTAEINAVGSSICSLNVSVLENITAVSLMMANAPDLSLCSIEQKSALYIIGKSSFSGQNSTAKIYYQLIRPYLGGAPVQDIQDLSTKNVNMDITTFMNLNPAVFMSLNVSEVQGLLGVNLADLKLFENSSAVQSWVVRQYQSNLNTLNIGLVGGKIPSVTSQPNITTVTSSQMNQTTLANSTAQASGASMFHAGTWSLPLCVGLLTIAHTVQTK
ncbi:hypothetical protein Q7C36_022311 [Tachysurus vachellii]|uniref:Uncharacterized protein n=1 Tax=Tachysurus vachellii TaxID=175792 RepID=A0AA88LIJ0_TACVA|nr:hypothetical protein Q7C36_022311 [Tachysurus vachellii]